MGTAAVIAIGTMLATPPPQATTVIIQEKTYHVHEDVYYEQVLHGDEVAYQVVEKP